VKFAVVLGTRPEIIKMAPAIRELERRNAGFFILHTGQLLYYWIDVLDRLIPLKPLQVIGKLVEGKTLKQDEFERILEEATKEKQNERLSKGI